MLRSSQSELGQSRPAGTHRLYIHPHFPVSYRAEGKAAAVGETEVDVGSGGKPRLSFRQACNGRQLIQAVRLMQGIHQQSPRVPFSAAKHSQHPVFSLLKSLSSAKGSLPMDYAARRQEQAQKTERIILQTALTLMRERGFDKVSIRDICREAGITTGAFYHHFSSKEALFTKGFSPLDLYMEKAIAGHEADAPSERLRVILINYARFIEQECSELTAQYYQQRLMDPMAVTPMDPTRFIHRAMLDCLKQAQREGMLVIGRSPEWLADFCYRHFRGVVIDWVLHGYGYSLLEKMMEDYDLFGKLFVDI
jgi:AcrR family transcriptional regulator